MYFSRIYTLLLHFIIFALICKKWSSLFLSLLNLLFLKNFTGNVSFLRTHLDHNKSFEHSKVNTWHLLSQSLAFPPALPQSQSRTHQGWALSKYPTPELRWPDIRSRECVNVIRAQPTKRDFFIWEYSARPYHSIF